MLSFARDVVLGGRDDKKVGGAATCNDCNRQFCLDYDLPICKGKDKEDIFTLCFRALAVLWFESLCSPG
jgi:hypothetical protein